MNVVGWTESWFVQLAGQTFICLALGIWIAARLERRPARAHAVVLLALIAAVSAPLASLLVRESNVGVFPGPARATDFLLADEQTQTSAGWIGLSVTDALVSIWALVTVALLLGIAISFLRGRRLIARSEPVLEPRLLEALAVARTAVRLRSRPELRSHPRVSSPMLWAWGRTPVALIPDESTAQVDGVDWESIFIHELAHLARRDHVVGLFADLAVAALFWNPASWWARQQLAKQSEFACDDRVAIVGKSPVEFAWALLALRREALIPRIPSSNLTGGRAWLKARVRRLLQITEPPAARFGAGWAAAAIVVTAVGVLALAFAQTRRGPRPETSFAPPLARAELGN